MARLPDTRITKLLGIRHPILGGGLMWLSDARYVAALVNAGCMGFITPRSYPSEQDFCEALIQCKAWTQGQAFGVNLTLSHRPEANASVPRWIEAALKHGVRIFETAGHAPARWIKDLRASNAIVIHKASSLRHALSAEQAGADAIALVGMEEGGHPGANEMSSLLMGALYADVIRVPLVVGGGIGRGKQLAAALAQGLDGVLIGSRFLVAEEISAHRRYKEHLLSCNEHSTVRLLQSLGQTWRVLRNETAQQIEAIERSGAQSHRDFGDLISGLAARDHCYREGDWQHGMVSLGPAIAFAHRIEPLQAIVNDIVQEAKDSIQRLCAMESL